MAGRLEYRKNVIDTQPDVAVGVKLPIVGPGNRLFQSSYTTEEQGLSNLKSLLLTRRGERYMQPTLGSSLYDYLFEPIYPGIEETVRNSLISDINTWLPYVVISNIQVSIQDDAGNYINAMKIGLYFSITEQGANQQLTYLINQNGVASIS